MRTEDMSPLWRPAIGFDRRSAAPHRDRCLPATPTRNRAQAGGL